MPASRSVMLQISVQKKAKEGEGEDRRLLTSISFRTSPTSRFFLSNSFSLMATIDLIQVQEEQTDDWWRSLIRILVLAKVPIMTSVFTFEPQNDRHVSPQAKYYTSRSTYARIRNSRMSPREAASKTTRFRGQVYRYRCKHQQNSIPHVTRFCGHSSDFCTVGPLVCIAGRGKVTQPQPTHDPHASVTFHANLRADNRRYSFACVRLHLCVDR